MKRRADDSKVEATAQPPSLIHGQRSGQTPAAGATATAVVQSGGYAGVVPSTVGAAVQPIKQELQYQIQSNYVTMPSITTAIKSQSTCNLQGGGGGAAPHTGILVQSHIRHKVGAVTPPAAASAVGTIPSSGSASGAGGGGAGGGTQQFQRLKVEDALSYLDQVKYKFNSQPQVYNDFLEIMKEFKSQCIDTPGVIARVSQLFKGYPELISGFNTFLPPGYKIEVQANDTGYSLQVSVSNPLGHHTISEIPPLTPTQPQSVVVTSQKAQPIYGSNTISTVVSSGVTVKERIVVAPTPTGAVSASNGPTVQTVVSTGANTGGGVSGLVAGGGSGGLGGIVNPSSLAGVGGLVAQVNHQNQSQANQPVEFNHAINYVNKIKNRFQGQPDKYKKFLEILHTYQKEQKTVKSGSVGGGGGGGKHLTEAEVYSQVAQLFEHHDDLLVEFGQFLPDATSHSSLSLASLGAKINDRKAAGKFERKEIRPLQSEPNLPTGPNLPTPKISPPVKRENPSKRSSSEQFQESSRSASVQPSGIVSSSAAASTQPAVRNVDSEGLASSVPQPPPQPPPAKRQKTQNPPANSTENFESIKRALRSQPSYENFLRCLLLFNEEVVSKSELLTLVGPMLARHSDQLNWFKDILGEIGGVGSGSAETRGSSAGTVSTSANASTIGQNSVESNNNSQNSQNHNQQNQQNQHHHHQQSLTTINMETRVINRDTRPDLMSTATTDIDFSSCKRIGASYCALPKSVPPPRCSGRTELCRQVLNDTWVSFPTWSEDSTFVTSRKTQYEEYIYRCEDERFELDLLIECNAATIRVLDGVKKKMLRLSLDELSKFRLDDSLGGTSPTIHVRAIRRLYGDRYSDVVEGLKRNPSVAVPVVLRRLKEKDIEWRSAQKGFNKTWRDQNEKFYLKSLDHQGINFKQNDLKTLRSKSLYNEIELVYDERNENSDSMRCGPHLTLFYADKSVIDDAANLLIHHVKRQTTIHKQDKTRIKQLLRQSLPDMFHHPRQDLSDDERESDKTDSESVGKDESSRTASSRNGNANNNNNNNESNTMQELPQAPVENDKEEDEAKGKETTEIKTEQDDKLHPDECYTLFYGNNHWYLFVRLHQILCERLAKMSQRSARIAEEEAANSVNRRQSTAVALRLKPNEHCQDCYGVMLDMVKSVLDCSMELQTYEDTLRNMFGIHAYLGFTLDRIVSYAVRQLQYLVSEENCVECSDLHSKFKLKGGTGGQCLTAQTRTNAESAYFKAVSSYLNGDTCFKILFYKKESKVTLEMLDTEGDEDENVGGDDSQTNTNSNKSKWSEYGNGNTMARNENKERISLNDRDRWTKAVYLIRNLNQKKWRDVKIDENSKGGGEDKCLATQTDKKVYVAIKESFLFKHGAINRARESHCRVSRRMHSRFESWHSAWTRLNVASEMSAEFDRWMCGHWSERSEGEWLPSSTTKKLHRPNETRPPYRPYYSYTVQYK